MAPDVEFEQERLEDAVGGSVLTTGERTDTPGERRSGRPRSARIDEAILKTTLRHLSERGYTGMSVNAIAAELGVSKPTIYLRWPSKAQLAAAAVAYLHVDQPDAPTGNLRHDLIAHLKRVQRVLDTVGIGVTGTVLAEKITNPQLIATFRERTIRPSRQRARRILQAGIREGVVRPDVDINAAVDLLVGSIYAAYVAGEEHAFDVETIVDTLLAGIGTDLLD